MNIRDANTQDAATIHRLGSEVAEFMVNTKTVIFWPLATLKRAIQSDDIVILVAEETEQIIGFVIAAYSPSLRKATIENIHVAPSFRTKGVGRALLQQMLARLEDIGCEYVITLVPATAHAAIALYEGASFGKGETFLWLDRTLSKTFKTTWPA